MSKRKPRPGDDKQGVFGFFIEPTAPEKMAADQAEASSFDRDLREVIATTLDDAAHRSLLPLRRDDVAEAMSKHLGRRVTKTQLDQWAAPSQDDRRIPVDALRALGLVTGDWRALHHLVEACGFKALTPQEAVCAEFGALHAVRRHIDQRARDLAGDRDGLAGDGLAEHGYGPAHLVRASGLFDSQGEGCQVGNQPASHGILGGASVARASMILPAACSAVIRAAKSASSSGKPWRSPGSTSISLR